MKIEKKFKIAFYLLLIIYLSIYSLVHYTIYGDAQNAVVEVIDNRAYFGATLNAIQNSKESIVIAIYLIAFHPERGETDVKKLLDALVSAKNRGVKIKVILEQQSPLDFTPKSARYHTYHFLKDNGIKVYYDSSPDRCLHAKTIIIDNEIIITGSTNWSESAFQLSDETNVLIHSRQLAAEVLSDIEKIPVRKEGTEINKNTFFIPISFVQSAGGALRRLVEASDERALDIILILWNENKNVISCDFIAGELDLTKRMDRTAWRRQIKKVLRKLEGKYKLIRFNWTYSEDNIGIDLLGYPGERAIIFPKEYFAYDWNKRLTLSGKSVLITLYAEQEEPLGGIISRPILYLSKKYGMEVSAYSKGIKELKYFNIIKVKYGKGHKERPDTKITIVGLYNMEEYGAGMEEIKKQYGEELTAEARALAGIIYCAYDTEVIKDILNNINCYGMEKVRKAFGYAKMMRPDNYKRNYRYILGILEKL